MSSILYLVRHGETLFNVQRKIQGWCDSPLTAHGIAQAKQLATYFDSIPLDHAYSSTSERAVDTADLIVHGRLPVRHLKALKEMNYGVFEGESQVLNPPLPKDFENFFVLYGGESSNTTGHRLLKALTNIMQQPDHQNVLVVSHSAACYNFLRQLQDPTDVLAKGLPNGAVLVFTFGSTGFHLLRVDRQKAEKQL
ncbi:histidine phosphatase family protein [Lacticaseibacillus camelliae]|nr:histidine phosphatase family protein [Lacticaseibacillus camelliae]